MPGARLVRVPVEKSKSIPPLKVSRVRSALVVPMLVSSRNSKSSELVKPREISDGVGSPGW